MTGKAKVKGYRKNTKNKYKKIIIILSELEVLELIRFDPKIWLHFSSSVAQFFPPEPRPPRRIPQSIYTCDWLRNFPRLSPGFPGSSSILHILPNFSASWLVLVQ